MYILCILIDKMPFLTLKKICKKSAHRRKTVALYTLFYIILYFPNVLVCNLKKIKIRYLFDNSVDHNMYSV